MWTPHTTHVVPPSSLWHLSGILDDRDDAATLHVKYPHVHRPHPLCFPPGHDYADQMQRVTHPEYAWNHSVGDVLDALIAAGLQIAFFHEHPFVPWKALSFLITDEQGYWRLSPEYPSFPLSFSLKATKA